MYISDAAQIRKADQIMIQEQGFPGLLLMETAGRKATEFILKTYSDADDFLLLIGPGNNGGDGLVIARYLQWAGKKFQLLLAHPPEKFKGDALLNWQALAGHGIRFKLWDATFPYLPGPNTVLIDALLGTGLKSAPRGPIGEIIAFYRAATQPCVAIDLPSGLSADSGQLVEGAAPIPAQHTLTFQLLKIGHCVTPASNYCGEVVAVDIGIWPDVIAGLGIQRQLLHGKVCRQMLKHRAPDAHKGSEGHALLIGGSRQYAGAIALSAHAALAAGAGLSTALTPEAARHAIYTLGPEVMVQAVPGDWLGAEQAAAAQARIARLAPKAIGIGPGLGQENAVAFLEAVLTATGDRPLVLDADALNALAQQPALLAKVPGHSILTPHPGEFRRLTGQDVAETGRLEAAEAFARKTGLILVLKGAYTIVAMPDGHTFINSTGNPGMATAGAGDVLTGVITALLAQGYAAPDAAALGVYIHGLAGDLALRSSGLEGLTAAAMLRHIGPAFAALRQQSTPVPITI